MRFIGKHQWVGGKFIYICDECGVRESSEHKYPHIGYDRSDMEVEA